MADARDAAVPVRLRCNNVYCRVQTYLASRAEISLQACPGCLGLGVEVALTVGAESTEESA